MRECTTCKMPEDRRDGGDKKNKLQIRPELSRISHETKSPQHNKTAGLLVGLKKSMFLFNFIICLEWYTLQLHQRKWHRIWDQGPEDHQRLFPQYL